jgi:hypothetical protein
MHPSWVHTPSPLEIARLQNSISHLKRTQEELQEYADDPDVAQAIKENSETLSVQYSLSAFAGTYLRRDTHTQSVTRRANIHAQAGAQSAWGIECQ